MNANSPDALREVEARLAEPFDADEVKWKPQTITKDQGRALAVAYVDARLVMDRLDGVLGVHGWQDEYRELADGSVACRLKCLIGGQWIVKEDVGGQSEQPDEHDRHKAAFSDALKRAAVKFGVGRYLYRLPRSWVDYDAQKKQITKPPALPRWALPGQHAPASAPAPVANGKPAPPDPEPPIGKDDAAELMRLLEEQYANPKDAWRRFSKAFHVDRLTALSTAQVQKAKAWIVDPANGAVNPDAEPVEAPF